jgi:hypothetical protein
VQRKSGQCVEVFVALGKRRDRVKLFSALWNSQRGTAVPTRLRAQLAQAGVSIRPVASVCSQSEMLVCCAQCEMAGPALVCVALVLSVGVTSAAVDASGKFCYRYSVAS